jgi:hypothetical protein
MKSIAKWLTQKGFTFKQVTVGSSKRGLMVDTGYIGMYPDAKTFDAHNMIRQRVSRYHKSLTTEPRGYYTAILIMEV